MKTGRSAEEVFIRTLFNNLKRLKVTGTNYAVMRNHNTLPFSAGGSDLDIMISGQDNKVKEIALDSISQCGGSPIGVSESIGFFKIYSFGICGTTNNTKAWWGLRLDFSNGVSFRGWNLLNRSAEWPVSYHFGIPVLSEELAGVIGVIKEVLHNDIIPARYINASRKAAIYEWPQMEGLLAPMGKSALDQLKEIIVSNLKPEEIPTRCAALKREIWRNAYSSESFSKCVSQRTKYELSKVRRYSNPSGVMVAVLGVDGAGKSALIESVIPILNDATHNAVVVQHLRPGILPPLALLKGKKNIERNPVLDPHRGKPSGTLGSILRMIYFISDYWVGYWLWVRPKIAKEPTFVIFDRYVYDVALDPRRLRIGLPKKYLWWFTSLVKKPDVIFCLNGDPETIAARKKELSIEETRRQVNELLNFAHNEPRAILISTDEKEKNARDHILNELLVSLGKRKWR